MKTNSQEKLRILIIKTSSLGDVIHTFPAITDLISHYPNVIIDWVVEEDFADLPQLHPAVNQVITIALRRWRKNCWNKTTYQEIKSFLQNLRSNQYDYIIDAQGLLKSAILTKIAKLKSKKSKYGLDSSSARGKYISWAYNKAISIPRDLHAIYRIKLLFSKIFDYVYDQNRLNYGIKFPTEIESKGSKNSYLVFLHCTTWKSKQWPISYWRELVQLALREGYSVKLNSGNEAELIQAQKIAKGFSQDKVEILLPQTINNLIPIIGSSAGVVCVDTGLGHLAAALDVQGVGIYGATNPQLTSILSHKFTNLSVAFPCAPCLERNCKLINADLDNFAPCYSTISPDNVWQALQLRM